MDNNQEIKDITAKHAKNTDVSDTINKNELVRKAIILKTERLVAAIHLITGLMDKEESIRHELRTLCVKTLDDLYAIGQWSSIIDGRTVSDKILKKISHIESLLDVSLQGGLISVMNHRILKEEYLKFKDALVRLGITSGVEAFSLSGEFFGEDLGDLRGVISGDLMPISPVLRGTELKDTIRDTNRMSHTVSYAAGRATELNNIISKRQIKRSDTKNRTFAGAVDHKNKRKELILSIIKDNINYTIKDIISLIIKSLPSVECSEKTIQRDLSFLVDSGLLSKRGERRWSVYSRPVVN